MNKIFFTCLAIFLLVILNGCSGTKNSVDPITSPQITSAQPEINAGAGNTDSTTLLLAGSFDIDLESGTITVTENREPLANYNITGFLGGACPGGCFKFRIMGIIGTVLTIELELTNPTSFHVFDVKLIYLNTYGKTVLNPDSYTDLFSKQINPFTAFAKEYADRAFPVGPNGVDTEELLLDFPPGAQASVDFIIVASLGVNTSEPYEINSMTVTGSLTPSGGNAELSCIVLDHQDDITAVYADTTIFTGGITPLTEQVPIPGTYSASITNSQGAPIGEYNVLVRADSPNIHNAHTYNFFTVNVSEGECGPIMPGEIVETIMCSDSLTGDFDIINGEEVTLEASGFTSQNAELYYSWDFGDSSPVENGESVNHVYENRNCGGSGEDVEYTLTLTVTDNCPSVPVTLTRNVVVKCVRDEMPLQISNETMVANTSPWGPSARRFSPALSQDDDGDLFMAAYYIDTQEYHQDNSAVLHSGDGLNWTWCQGMTGGYTGNYHDTPIKATPNKGETYSYATYTWNSDGRVASLKCSVEGYNFDFADYYSQYNRELFVNRTTGYVFYFSAPNNQIHMQRSPIPNVVDYVNEIYLQDYGSFANGDNPQLSMTRSIAEDESTGLMYLTYFNESQDAIKLASSDSPAGDTWSLSTLYADDAMEYVSIYNPTIDIDDHGRMHVAFLRQSLTTGEFEIVYMLSTDFGQTICLQHIVDIAVQITEPSIDWANYNGTDWIGISYEKDSDIYMALSEDGGHSFGHMSKISETGGVNFEPDSIILTDGWMQFVWTNGDPAVDSQLYCRKVNL